MVQNNLELSYALESLKQLEKKNKKGELKTL